MVFLKTGLACAIGVLTSHLPGEKYAEDQDMEGMYMGSIFNNQPLARKFEV